jgi:hypothetical protein
MDPTRHTIYKSCQLDHSVSTTVPSITEQITALQQMIKEEETYWFSHNGRTAGNLIAADTALDILMQLNVLGPLRMQNLKQACLKTPLRPLIRKCFRSPVSDGLRRKLAIKLVGTLVVTILNSH